MRKELTFEEAEKEASKEIHNHIHAECIDVKSGMPIIKYFIDEPELKYHIGVDIADGNER